MAIKNFEKNARISAYHFATELLVDLIKFYNDIAEIEMKINPAVDTEFIEPCTYPVYFDIFDNEEEELNYVGVKLL